MRNKNNKDKTVMTASEVAVILEDVKSQFRVFGDELKTINRKIEGIETTTARSWEKISHMDLRFIRVEKEVKSIREDLKTFDQRIAKLEEICPK